MNEIDAHLVIKAAADQLLTSYREIIVPYLGDLDFLMIQREVPEATRVHILNRAHDRIMWPASVEGSK